MALFFYLIIFPILNYFDGIKFQLFEVLFNTLPIFIGGGLLFGFSMWFIGKKMNSVPKEIQLEKMKNLIDKGVYRFSILLGLLWGLVLVLCVQYLFPFIRGNEIKSLDWHLLLYPAMGMLFGIQIFFMNKKSYKKEISSE